MGGLRYESLADMPAGMRSKVAAKITVKAVPVAGQSKYHNQKTEIEGIQFDSKKEAKRYAVLMDAKREGIIFGLRLQEEFTLREGYRTDEGERISAIRYRADFTYYVSTTWFQGLPKNFCFDDVDYNYWAKIAQSGGSVKVIEDVKSPATRTKEYRMKYKLMADKGYKIREI